MNFDAINGSFEFVGAVAAWRNVLFLRRAGSVVGISKASVGFFTAWGVWNLAYYPSLEQWWSTAGGLALAAGNVAWVILALRLSLRNKSANPKDT